jgi:hypothetical protein
MADQLQLRGGTTAETATFTGALREVTVDTDKDTLVVHDNALAGGYPLLRQDLSNLPAGTIDNADINASAAIVDTKLATIATAGKVSGTAITSGNISTSGSFTSTSTVTGTNLIPTGSGVPTNGIYLPAANSVAVATNGVERVEFGTSEVVFNDGGANYDFRIEGDTNANLFFVDASAEAVGIGNSAPEEKLDIQGAGRTTLRIFNSTAGSAASPQLTTIDFNGYALIPKGRIEAQDQASDYSGGWLAFSTANAAGTLTKALTIDNQQRVGIGTTSPGVKVDIVSDNNTSLASVLRVNSNNVAVNTSLAYDGLIGSGELTVRAGASAALILGSSATERARIDSSGRLLVGTSTALTGSNSQYSKVVALGNSANNAAGYFSIAAGSTRDNGEDVANLWFTDNGAGEYASIRVFADGATGSGDYPGRLVFSTTADGASSPTERMRIANDGSFSSFAVDFNGTFQTAASAGTTYSVLSGWYGAASNLTAGTNSFRVWSNGNVVNTNNSYGAISDIKLKENIVGASSQWDDLKALQVRNYNFKEGQTHTQIGLVAQEAELVSPGLVSESPDRDEDGNDLGTVTKSVNYSVLYMKAVKALQEAMERIEVLEQRLTDAGIA